MSLGAGGQFDQAGIPDTSLINSGAAGASGSTVRQPISRPTSPTFNRQPPFNRRPTFSPTSVSEDPFSRRPTPPVVVVEDIVFGRQPTPASGRPQFGTARPGGRLPPIQQPPRDRNDVLGLPDALPPTIQEEPRPPRRRPLRPSTGNGRPAGKEFCIYILQPFVLPIPCKVQIF